MCGLAGVILKKKDRTDNELSLITKGFTRMLKKADMRGGHATGFAVIDSFGGFILMKRPQDAYEFCDSQDTKDALQIINKDVTCILGHTRYATLGTPKVNKNNHPIRTGNTIGTHNGSIHNHKELFKKYNMERHAQVDSEAIFRLYETSESAKDFSDNRLPDVRGRVAIVWSDLEYPEYVYMVKGNNPLEMAFIPGLDIYIYGSTSQILKASNWLHYKPINVDPNTMLRINTNTLKIRTKSIKHKKPATFKYQSYNKKIGAYVDTVSGFVPRYSHKEQQNLFSKVKASDGSTIRRIK